MTSYENPMQDKGVKNEIKKKKRDSRMKKIRKKLSIGARVKRNSLGQSGGGGGGLTGGEVKTVSDIENVVSMHVEEETGRRYSYNAVTGQTQWLSDGDEEDGTSAIEE